MEYFIPTVMVLTATTVLAAGDDTNYLGSSDINYNTYGYGSDQSYKGGQGYEEVGRGYEKESHGHGKGGHGKDYYAEPHYAFAYEVHDDHTGDIKAHKEERKGDHTQGMYMLVEPNGSKRIVEYIVLGKSGFNAKVHQSKPQEPHGSHGGYAGGHVGGHPPHSGFTAGHPGHGGGHAGYTTGGHAGYTTGGHAGYSGYAGGHAGHSGGHGSYTGYTEKQTDQNTYAGYHTNSLGDYATGYYSAYHQSPYKVQENIPNYNYKPSISNQSTFNLQPFKPLIPYIPSEPQHPKDSFPYSKPLAALYRPQTSYKPFSLNRPISYKVTRAHKQNSYDHLHSHRNQGHAISSVSFSSHGSKIASSTNHVVPQQRRYENQH